MARYSPLRLLLSLPLALTSFGCQYCEALGKSLPVSAPDPGKPSPLRFDALYVHQYRIPEVGYDYIDWIRVWPDGRAVRSGHRAQGLPATAVRRGRYVIVGECVFMEFCVPDPDADRLVLRTWSGQVDRDGGITFHEVQTKPRWGRGKPIALAPPHRYQLHVVGSMHRQPDE